jgi:DNA-binding NarL/FixJ family response regulator
VVGAKERWRELRAQGAQLDAAARGAPGRRRLEAVPEATSAAKPLGLVWVVSPYYSITTEGLKKILESKAYVHIDGESCAGSPSCVVLYAGGGLEESCLEGVGGIRELYPGVPLLVFGSQLDLGLACAALKNGADGFAHAQMDPAQVLRAVEVVQKGELAAPRQLLGYLLNRNEKPEIGDLSARGREILEMVVEGLSNAEIAGRLYLSESTIKQHLRAVYKELGVRNRTEAAKRYGSTLEASKRATKPSAREERTLSFLSPIHSSAWKGNSTNFSLTEFSEVVASDSPLCYLVCKSSGG